MKGVCLCKDQLVGEKKMDREVDNSLGSSMLSTGRQEKDTKFYGKQLIKTIFPNCFFLYNLTNVLNVTELSSRHIRSFEQRQC